MLRASRPRRWALVLTALGLACAIPTRPLVAQVLGPEFQVNSYTTFLQRYSAVAADGSGNFVVVWQSFGQDGSAWGVFGQRFDSAGDPAGPEFQINSYTVDQQYVASVAANSAGDFAVAWQSLYQDGSDRGVFGQRFDSVGQSIGPEFQINTSTQNNQMAPAVASNGHDGFVVVWWSYGGDGSGAGIVGRRIRSVGPPMGEEFRVNTYTTGSQLAPSVAADGQGNFIVVWQSHSQDGSEYGVFGQRFDPAGDPVGSEFQANSYTTGDQVAPRIAASGSGAFVVVWNSEDQDGSDAGVFGQQFDPAGLPVGGEFQVNSDTTWHQSWPAIAADGPGNFVVVWQSYGDGSYWGVFGQQFDSTGLRVGPQFQVNAYTTDNQFVARVAANGLGKFLVAWDSSGQDGSHFGVFGRRGAFPIFADGFESGDTSRWSSTAHRLPAPQHQDGSTGES